MKSCVEMPFGISADEDVFLKASIALLCFFSLLLAMVLFLIAWLRNIQRRVELISKNTCSLPLVISDKRNSWKHLTGVAACGPLGLDGDDPPSADSPQKPFGISTTQEEEDRMSVQDFNVKEETVSNDTKDASCIENVCKRSGAQQSSGKHVKDGKLKKVYMSLKTPTNHIYEKRHVDSSRVGLGQGQCAGDGEVPQMNYDKCEGRKASQENQKDNTDEDDQGYLVIIHSDESAGLSEGAENEMPPHEDESLYLIPVESESEENGRHKKETESGEPLDGKVKADDMSKKDGRVSSRDVLHEDKYENLSTQHVGKLTTFGHNAIADVQQSNSGETSIRSGISKSADEDGYGYLLVKHVEDRAAIGGKADTDIPADLSQAGGVPESSRPMDPSYGDDDNYEYITTREVNDLSGSPNNDAFKLQKKAEPSPNSSTKDSHDYLTDVDEREANNTNYKAEPGAESATEDFHDYLNVIHKTSEQGNTTDQIYADVQNNNNNCNVGASSIVCYVNQEVVQNGPGYSDDFPVYANNEVQRGSSVCYDNPTFYDESPIYDNDKVNV